MGDADEDGRVGRASMLQYYLASEATVEYGTNGAARRRPTTTAWQEADVDELDLVDGVLAGGLVWVV
ncbi:hypothetical protein GOP47_0008176 [Adiantum capillus-veneris]|uniref:Uncharacterized protein n=1 Tax=Adiantum capillus-veneris TaxID=13818 RepID=A0A9D4UXY4_ADICA|nr:hypothetical protein GOP47_0008176 [Adiantum capillus-veneris]